MRGKAVLIATSIGATVVGAFVGADLGRASATSGCGSTRGGAITDQTAGARGSGLTAVIGRRSLIVLDGGGARQAFDLPEGAAGVVRHTASRPGVGTAFVLDRRGADVIVIQTAREQLRLAQPGEASNPSWSDNGRLVWSLGSRLRVWSSTTRAAIDIAPPASALSVFAPVFTSDDTILAVVAEPEPGVTRTEDEGLDDLWRYDVSAHRWSRITAFHASGDRWVALRTPVVRADGAVELVLVRGSASATRMPSFELWRVSPSGVPSKVRDLPREMYLAGIQDGRRIWNLYDLASGEWRLYAETSPTTLVDLGCGAVLVDPRSVPDPDRTPPQLDTVPRPIPSPTPTSVPTTTPTVVPTAGPSATSTPSGQPTVAPDPVDGYIAGILVGDFSDVDTATAAATAIHDAFGPEAPVEVVNSLTAPNIVRPGVWAAVLLLSNGVDPLAALADFRSRLPAFHDWSWVVSA